MTVSCGNNNGISFESEKERLFYMKKLKIYFYIGDIFQPLKI